MIEQGSYEWHEQRLGKVTASRVADVMAKTRNGYGAARENYMVQLLCERLTGKPAENFVSEPMRRGIELEPVAAAWYEIETNAMIETCGFYEHPTIKGFGASPDRLLGDDGLIEIKCPNTATHLAFLLSGKIDKKYQWQMTAQIACTGRGVNTFISFDDRLPDGLQGAYAPFEPTDEMRKDMEAEIIKFLAELDERESHLRERIKQ